MPALRVGDVCVPRGAPSGEGEWYRGAFRLTANAVGRFLFHGDKTVKQSARIENNGV